MTKTVLLTGGTGFLGRHLIEKLYGRDFNIQVLSRQTLPSNDKIQYVTDLAELSRTPDIIINLAGEPLDSGRWTDAVKKNIYQSRIDTTRNLVDYLGKLETKPEVLISGSAIGYYGTSLDTVFTEKSTPNKQIFSSVLCQDWEREAIRAESFGIRVCRIRTGVVLGADGGMLQKVITPFKFGLGATLGDGQQWFSWIHLDDWVNSVLFLIDTPQVSGHFNLTAPSPVSNFDFTKTLAKTLGRPQFLTLPGFVVRALFGPMSDELLLAGQKVIPKALSDNGFKFRFPDLTQALNSLMVESR